MAERTRDGPSASTASVATSAESMPPDSETKAPGKPRLSTKSRMARTRMSQRDAGGRGVKEVSFMAGHKVARATVGEKTKVGAAGA